MSKLFNLSLGFTAILFIMSLSFFAIALIDMEPDAALTPILVCSIMIVLCIWLFFAEWKRLKQADTEESASTSGSNEGKSDRPWWLMLVLSVLYFVLLILIGFYLATFLFLIVVPYIYHYRNLKGIALSCLVFVFIYWLGFQHLMSIRFPSGMLFS